jgi:hypothetical protein
MSGLHDEVVEEEKGGPATYSWECQNCGNFWFESNQEGSDWMLEKVEYLYGVPHDRAFLSHVCDACTGVYWEGGHEERNTHTGTFNKINTRAKFWRTGPSATTHPQLEAPSSRGGSQVGIPQDQELRAQKDHLNSQYGSSIWTAHDHQGLQPFLLMNQIFHPFPTC